MQAIRQAIGSLKTQIDAEKKKLTSAKDVALNRTASVYLEYKQLLDFQTELYKLSMSAVEKMRVESARKVKTLAILSHPQLADDAEFPKPGYLLLVWFFSLSMLFGFVRLVLEIIEDHRD
jgi:capsular polysaccharide transport system permease protein